LIRLIALLSLFANILFPAKTAIVPYSTELTGVQAQYQFGGTLSIQAHYTEFANLQQAELTLQSSNRTPVKIPLAIANDGTLSANVNLADLNLPLFSRIYYWVNFTYSDASSQASASYWFDYMDNRFTWQTNESKWFTIHWTNGNQTYGDELQQLALAGLKNATKVLPESPDLPIIIYVYPESASLPALSSSEPAWVAAEALTESNTILVSASVDLNSTQDLERQLPHEIVHLLEFKLTQQNFTAVPAWLLEGLASNAEASPNPDFARALQSAVSTHTLLPMNQLCHAFSPNSSDASLAYAQSASFTSYLTSTYGNDKITQLLSNSGSGLDCSQLVNSVIGISLETADAAWQKSVFPVSENKASVLKYWPFLVLILLIFATLIFLRRQSLKKKEKKNGLEQ